MRKLPQPRFGVTVTPKAPMIRMRPQIMKLGVHAQSHDDNSAYCTKGGGKYRHGVTPNLSFGQVTFFAFGLGSPLSTVQ